MKKKILLFVALIVISIASCNNDDIFHNENEIAPRLNYIYPEKNTKNVNTNTSILFEFDMQMNKDSINNKTVILKDQDQNVIEGDFEFYGENAVIFHPKLNSDKEQNLTTREKLETNKTYTLKIKNNVKDSLGVKMKNNFVLNFQTGTYYDEHEPYETDFKPTNNEIKIYYNEPLNPLSVEKAIKDLKIKLKDENNNDINYSAKYDVTNSLIKITPQERLSVETIYLLSIEAESISDLAGNYNKTSFNHKFKNGKPQETICPTVISVERTNSIILEFSENVDRNTLEPKSLINPIELKDKNNKLVEYKIGYIEETKKIILVPLVPLIENENYFLTIHANKISDLVGNYLEDTLNYKLKGTNIPNTEPVINSILKKPEQIFLGDKVTLIAVAEDADGDSLNFRWNFVAKPKGSNASLEIEGNKVSFTVDVEGDYEIKCFVRDKIIEISKTEIISTNVLKLVGSYKRRFGATGDIIDTFVQDNFLYVACRSAGLKIFDITDPENPIFKGSVVTGGLALEVCVSGNIAAIADYYGHLKIIDVSNPSLPRIVATYETYIYISEIDISGNYVYVADDSSGLKIIDISKPKTPHLVGQFDTDIFADAVCISNKIAYVLDFRKGLIIIDVSNPATPIALGELRYNDLSVFPEGIYISKNFAYIVDSFYGIKIVDVTDPSNPQLKGSIDIDGYLEEISVLDNYAYVADYGGLKCYDISDPTNPVLLGKLDLEKNLFGICISGNYAYVANNDNGLKIIDISIPAKPKLKKTIISNGYAYNLHLSGNFAYIAYGSDGVKFIDVSDPASPQLISSIDTDDARSVFVSGNYAYVADNKSGLKIIDITDIKSPKIIGSYFSWTNTFDVKVKDNYAYVANFTKGLLILDVSDPKNPIFVKQISDGLYVDILQISNNYLYCCGSLHIFDISNPTEPQLVGKSKNGGSGLYVSGDYVYLTTDSYSGGLSIVDISNLSEPVFKSKIRMDGRTASISVLKNYAYVADRLKGLKVIDISNKVAPQLKNVIKTDGSVEGVFVSDNGYLYTVDGTSAELLKIYEIIE